MTLLFCDGFDHYTTILDKWDDTTGVSYVPVIGGAYARYGAGGCTFQTQGSGWETRIAVLGKNVAIGASGVVGFALRTGLVSTGEYRHLWIAREGATTHLQVGFSALSPHVLSVYNGVGTLIGTGTIGMVQGTWNYVEIGFAIADLGSFTLKINGAVSVAASGVDTKNGGAGLIDYVRWRNNLAEISIDDVYITSGSTFFGDVQVEALLPNGAGTHSQWTASAGSNYQTVDEAVPNNDTDYNQTSTDGAADSYVYAHIPDVVTVFGVQSVPFVRKTTSGFRRVRSTARVGGVDYDLSGDLVVNDSYQMLKTVSETNPAGGAWDSAAINAAEFGLRVSG